MSRLIMIPPRDQYSKIRILPMPKERMFYINPYDPEFKIDTYNCPMSNGHPTLRARVPVLLEGETTPRILDIAGSKYKQICDIFREIQKFLDMIENQRVKARKFKRSKMIYRSKA